MGGLGEPESCKEWQLPSFCGNVGLEEPELPDLPVLRESGFLRDISFCSL